MKAHLLFRDRDLEADEPIPNEADLVTDLELDHLFAAMADGDRFLFDVARSVVLHSLDDTADILFRQNVLQDCLNHPDIAKKLYAITSRTLEQKREFWLFGTKARPESVLHQSLKILEMLMEQLAELRAVAETHHDDCRSEGLTTLLTDLERELDDNYVEDVHAHIEQLRFRYGMRMSAQLGQGNEGTDYLLHSTTRPSWRERLRLRHPELVVVIAPRDEAGFHALADIRDRGLVLVAAALEEATQHIVDFITVLHSEAAFYVSCLNLADALGANHEPVCIPDPQPGPKPESESESESGSERQKGTVSTLVARGLYDPCLSLLSRGPVVGNDINGDGISVIFITGANRGGKSTGLRSIGIAQLMMQAGMFVGADEYRSDIRPSIFTHFKREEDTSMTSGKLDEELRRMSGIVDNLRPDSLLLCNESFGSTNEREGSHIGTEVVTAMRYAGVKVVYVTHLFELAEGFKDEGGTDVLFLRAPRSASGSRSFALVEGEPLPTSYGADIYERVFGQAPSTV